MSAQEVEAKPSLGALIRQVLEQNPDPEIEGVVDDVLALIDPLDYAAYLAEAITSRISSEVGYLRSKTTPGIRKGVSTKQSLIRDEYWPNFLNQRIWLATGYKFLADATSDDLRIVAAQRQAQANELMFRADQFTTLAQLMDKAKARVLSDLSAAEGKKVLERAA